MPSRRNPEFGRAFFTVVAPTPLGLLAEEVQEAIEQLLGRHLAVEDGDAVGVHRAQDGAGTDQSTTKAAIPFRVGKEERWKRRRKGNISFDGACVRHRCRIYRPVAFRIRLTVATLLLHIS